MMVRYLFQAAIQQFLHGTPYEALIHQLELDHPKGALLNVAVSLVFYVATSFGSYLCLRFLHKEKR